MEDGEFHILLVGSSYDQALQQLGIYKYRICSNVNSSTGEIFNQLDRAVHHNFKQKGAEKMPSISKKRMLRKMFKSHFLCSNQKLASTQTIGSAILERVRKVHNSKHEHDWVKKIDCFIDFYAFVNKDHVNFSMKK